MSQEIRAQEPIKKKPDEKKLTYTEAVALVPGEELVTAMVQKGIDLKNTKWTRRRSLDELRAAPSGSIRLIGPDKAFPLTIVFLRKQANGYFYAFIKAIQPEEESKTEKVTE
jgi:hypothetical protein